MKKLDALFQSTGNGAFLGVERADPADAIEGDVMVLGIPGATPYKSAGAYCAAAPAAIRAASSAYAANILHYDFDLAGPIMPPGRRLIDGGDIAFDESDFPANRQRVASAISTILDRGATPVVLGGDDSVQIPLLQSFAARGDFTILQIDAHIDWRDEVQGERYGLSSTMRRASELPAVRAMLQVGARGIGSARPSDVQDALAYGAKLFDMRSVRSKGIHPVSDAIPSGVPVVVCLDVDALDPSEMPGVLAPAPGGLSYGTVVELLHAVTARAPVAGFNIVEFVPENDLNGRGATVAARLAIVGAGLAARAKYA